MKLFKSYVGFLEILFALKDTNLYLIEVVYV